MGRGIMPFIGIGRGAGDLCRSVDAIMRNSDYATAIDGICRGGLVELHGRASFWRKRDASVLAVSCCLNAF